MGRQAQYNSEFNKRFGKKRSRRKVRKVGKIFTTKKGRRGRYVYVNGKRVAFEAVRSRRVRRR